MINFTEMNLMHNYKYLPIYTDIGFYIDIQIDKMINICYIFREGLVLQKKSALFVVSALRVF